MQSKFFFREKRTKKARFLKRKLSKEFTLSKTMFCLENIKEKPEQITASVLKDTRQNYFCLQKLNGSRAEPLSFEGCGEIEIPAFLVLLTPKEPVGDI